MSPTKNGKVHLPIVELLSIIQDNHVGFLI